MIGLVKDDDHLGGQQAIVPHVQERITGIVSCSVSGRPVGLFG